MRYRLIAAVAAATALVALGATWAGTVGRVRVTNTAAASAARQSEEAQTTISRIAFGSCLKQNRPQPVWDGVLAQDPDLFVFLGDNIYADTKSAENLARSYDELAARTGFQRLLGACAVIATWDDHDYSVNGAGSEYRGKKEAQQVFADFWGEGPDSARRQRDGVYDAYVFGPEGKRVQVILLDERFFKSRSERTLLGEAQWKWLEEQLRVPAEVRLVASGTQFVSRHHGGDKWADIPGEMDRMVDVINRTGAQGVIFLSGDRHHAELSRLTSRPQPGAGVTETGTSWDPRQEPLADTTPQPRYPIYDITASSLNRGKLFVFERNPDRVGKPFSKSNFGLIEIDWTRKDPTISMQVRDVKGNPRIRHEVKLSELRG